MKLKLAVLAVTSVTAVTGFTGSAATAHSTGDSGGPPQNKAQCKKFLKSVDDALVWENNRYDKVFAKLDKRRTALKKKAAAINTEQDTINTRMAEIAAALDDEANPPSDADGAALVAEDNDVLIPKHDQNARDLKDIADTLDGLKFDFSEALKLHKGNVKSTVKYRKQVATYCKRFG